MTNDLNLDDLDDLDFMNSPILESESAGKPRWASHACGAYWRNHERGGHCPDCHVTFTSDSGFESHRYGPYDTGRQCRSTDELAALGWTSKPGDLRNESATSTLWSMPAPTESPWKRAAK
jgi:hypothetical protein